MCDLNHDSESVGEMRHGKTPTGNANVTCVRVLLVDKPTAADLSVPLETSILHVSVSEKKSLSL